MKQNLLPMILLACLACLCGTPTARAQSVGGSCTAYATGQTYTTGANPRQLLVCNSSGTWSLAKQFDSNGDGGTIGDVGIGTANPKAQLDISGGLRIGSSSGSSSACSSSTAGEISYNSCLNGKLCYCNGATSTWQVLSTAAASTSSCASGNITSGTLNTITKTAGAGTVKQSGTTVTGTGTSFTSAMIGDQLLYANGTFSGIITGYTSATSLTVATSQTVSTAESYTIYSFAETLSVPANCSVTFYAWGGGGGGGPYDSGDTGGAGGGGGSTMISLSAIGSSATFYLALGGAGTGGGTNPAPGGVSVTAYNGGLGYSTTSGGGGGASGVWLGTSNSGTILIIAGGGGGGRESSTTTGVFGGAGGAAGSGTNSTNVGAAGTNGNPPNGGGGGGVNGGAVTEGGGNYVATSVSGYTVNSYGSFTGSGVMPGSPYAGVNCTSACYPTCSPPSTNVCYSPASSGVPAGQGGSGGTSGNGSSGNNGAIYYSIF